MSIESQKTPLAPTITVANPDHPVIFNGQAYGELYLCLAVHTDCLGKAVAVLQDLNPHGSDERLADLQGYLHGLALAMSGLSRDVLRGAQQQGLHFELAGLTEKPQNPLH